MKLSARTRYASRILLELARYETGGPGKDTPVSAARLSAHTGVSVQFVEQILKTLRQAGFTKSLRGAGGGHSLAMPPAEISLDKIVGLMEGGVYLTLCSAEDGEICPRQEGCVTRGAWMRVSQVMEQELKAITLADLLQHHSCDAKEILGLCAVEKTAKA